VDIDKCNVSRLATGENCCPLRLAISRVYAQNEISCLNRIVFSVYEKNTVSIIREEKTLYRQQEMRLKRFLACPFIVKNIYIKDTEF
jgi:hypothetical protein